MKTRLKKLSEVMEAKISDGAKIRYAKIFARRILSPRWITFYKVKESTLEEFAELESIKAINLHHNDKPVPGISPGVSLVIDPEQTDNPDMFQNPDHD